MRLEAYARRCSRFQDGSGHSDRGYRLCAGESPLAMAHGDALKTVTEAVPGLRWKIFMYLVDSLLWIPFTGYVHADSA